jgi:alpha-D-ribose 1-methylphosphonate 5-phosphate C-P lyase
MAGPINRFTSKGQLVPLFFGQDAVAASQTDVQLPVTVGEASQAVTGYEMPFSGSIVALSYDLSAAGTTGTFTIGATVNGTEDTDTTVSVGTNAAGYTRVGRNAARFVAGDSIGAEITTGGTWDGTTADLAVVVWVLVDLEGI